MRNIKVVVMFFFLWTPLQMSLAIHFLNPIGLLVFFLLICKNSLHIKAFCCWSVTQSGLTLYACKASLSFTMSWSLLKLMFIELVMPSNDLILCAPFSSCLPSFLASGSFPMSQFFTSGGQSIGALASASVPPMNNLWLITCYRYLSICIICLLFY